MGLKFIFGLSGLIVGWLNESGWIAAAAMFFGYHVGALLTDKEADGEKIIRGLPHENSSFPNFKRTHANSLRWASAGKVLRKFGSPKKDFYLDSFVFVNHFTRSHFSFIGKMIMKHIERKPLRKNWEDLKKGSLIVGSMGQGKTEFILNIMTQFAGTNRRMVIHDTKGEFTELFYREDKDFILNHLEQRGLYWDFYIDNAKGLPVSLILDFFHAYFIAVAGDRADKYWSTMAAKRFEEYFNEVKIDDSISMADKMEEFLARVLIYFDLTKQSSNKTEQSIVATLEASFDIFLKLLYMRKAADESNNKYKLFLFSDYFSGEHDTRIFLHTIEEVARVNTPFVAAFITILFKIQLSVVAPKKEEYILYSLDEYLTFFSLLGSDLKKSLHTKARSTGALLLPAIQYLPKDEEDRKNLLSSVENLYYFAATDPETKKKFSEMIGQTHITRVNESSHKSPDLREEKIDLVDDNITSSLRVGHHISFYPKNQGILYVGYTKQTHLKKISEGYLRQSPETENDFIRFKEEQAFKERL